MSWNAVSLMLIRSLHHQYRRRIDHSYILERQTFQSIDAHIRPGVRTEVDGCSQDIRRAN